MSELKDRYVKSSGTSTKQMTVTNASALGSTVFIMATEQFSLLRCLVVRTDGSKCEFTGSEQDFRAARAALNLFAAAQNWDSKE